MGTTEQLRVADGYVRQRFDKNAAADYLSKLLGKEITGEAVRQLHVRGTCPASGTLPDRRLYWTRETLDIYASRRNFFNALPA